MEVVNVYRLEIFKGPDVWMIRSNDPQVKQLFRTDTLPSPFGIGFDSDYVRQSIKELNPDKVVFIVER